MTDGLSQDQERWKGSFPVPMSDGRRKVTGGYSIWAIEGKTWV